MLGNALHGDAEKRHTGYTPGSPFIRRHVTATRGRPVSIASVGYSFIGLLRAGNFQFDYKLPERQPTLRVSALFLVSLFRLLRQPPPPPPPAFPPQPLCHSFSRRPDEKLSSLDRDGIIGRPTLFMAFIFLEIAAEAQSVRHFSPSCSRSLSSFLASFSSR